MIERIHILSDIIVKNNIKIFAEIGVERGRLMRTLLRAPCREILTEYWAIDPWQKLGLRYGPKIGYRTEEQWYQMYCRVCQYMPFFKQLRVLRLPSVEASRLFEDGYFDMVYIDADHCYLAVKDDIKSWLPKIRGGGIIGGHDYDLRDVSTAVDEQLGETERITKKVWIKKKLDKNSE